MSVSAIVRFPVNAGRSLLLRDVFTVFLHCSTFHCHGKKPITPTAHTTPSMADLQAFARPDRPLALKFGRRAA